MSVWVVITDTPPVYKHSMISDKVEGNGEGVDSKASCLLSYTLRFVSLTGFSRRGNPMEVIDDCTNFFFDIPPRTL